MSTREEGRTVTRGGCDNSYSFSARENKGVPGPDVACAVCGETIPGQPFRVDALGVQIEARGILWIVHPGCAHRVKP
jgi:hypothetical protein